MTFAEIQKQVHVSKDKKNDFGGYNYRTAEGILAAIKAVLSDGDTIVVSDEIRELAGQIFVESTATLMVGGEANTAKGFALHPLSKKGMDPSQVTGSASSYARKYALSGLMALDDGSVDPDASKEAYEPAPPEFNAPAERDRLKTALEKQQTKQAINILWSQQSFQAVFDKLPAPMQNEVKKAKSDCEDKAINDPGMQAPSMAAE